MGVLKGLVIALAGDIKDSSNTTISTEQLKRWINANDGRWTSRVGPGTTHLICSADAWKKGVESGTSWTIFTYAHRETRRWTDGVGTIPRCSFSMRTTSPSNANQS